MTPSAARVWVSAAFFVAGTLAGLDRGMSPLTVPVAAAGAIALFQRSSRVVQFVGFAVLLAVAGFTNASMRSTDVAVERLAVTVPRCEIEGTVAEHAGGLGTILAPARLSCGGEPIAGPLGEVVLDGRVGEPGGTFAGTARLVPLGSNGFSEGRRRAGADASITDAELRWGPPRGIAPAAAGRVRRSLQAISQHLPERSGALLLGLAMGDTSGFTESDERNFRRSGLAHLTAVSGSNVAIVIGAVVLAARRTSHRVRIVLAAGALALYVLIVGPEPSVLRAAAMGAIALVALLYNHRTQPLNVLALALCVVVAFRPSMVHSVGLQLSALATAGLVVWSGALIERLGWLPRPIALVAGATIAAQFAVAPLIAGVFGEVSVSGPLSNVLAAAAVAPATILSLAAAVAGCFSFPAGVVVAHAAEPFARWILWVSDVFGSPGWASVAVGSWFVLPATAVGVLAAAHSLGRVRNLS